MTSRDVVAAEAHYHHSCYKNYTRMKMNHEPEGDRGDGDVTVEKEAYANLFEYIRTDIIPNKKIVPITSLAAKLKSFDAINESTFAVRVGGFSMHIPDDKGWLLMVPDSVTLQDVVLENQILHRELGILKAKVTDLNKIIDHGFSKNQICYIKEHMRPTPWPSDVNSPSIPHQLE